jgi:hypothetical protein
MNEEENNRFVYVRHFLHKMREEDFVTCSCYMNIFSPGEMHIPMPKYIPRMTKEEAYEKGWRITENKDLCGPGDSYAWLCPECAEEFEDLL